MKTYILPLSDPSASLETVGGKGMSLSRLANAGLPVPGGFHITTDAYRQFVNTHGLQEGIEVILKSLDVSRPAALESASKRIAALFDQAPVPGEVAHAIVQAYAALPGPNPPVAIRSSATAEDLPEASFAGQHATFLNVSGAEHVLAAVKQCWASLWTGRAIGYRARREIPADGVALAVVVQQLVNAEAAGILFTVNPLSGSREETVINAAWGLGEAVVGGQVTPDTITVRKTDGKVLQSETADKRVMTVLTAAGTQEQPVPEPLRKVPVLNGDETAVLMRFGEQIEDLYGRPMDIEWALADGDFTILQARPVTSISELQFDWSPPDPKGIYARASVADLMPKPLSPLYATLGVEAQRKQMQPLGKRLSGGEPRLASDYYTTINSYAYLNGYFPFQSWGWIIFRMLPMTFKFFGTLRNIWQTELHPEYQVLVASKQGLVPAQMSPQSLWGETQALVDAAAYYVCGLMFATMGASAGSEGLLTQVYDRMVKREGDPDASVLLMGWDSIAIRSEKSLYDIAMWVREHTELDEFISNSSSDQIADLLEKPEMAGVPLFSEFASRFQAHLDQFGYVIFQLDFAEPLPRDCPEMLLNNIKMYLRGEGSDPYTRQKTSEQRRIETTETMLGRVKGIKRWIFQKALNWAQPLAEVREDALAEIGLAYPKMRALLRELGSRFAAAKAIRQAEDIYWLEKDEIGKGVDRLERGQALEDMTGSVEKRKAFNRQVGKVQPPPMIPMKKRMMGIKVETFIAHTLEDQAADLLKGVPTSAGKVTARARVLHGPEDFDRMQPGEVLVAGTTTPAWTPLFSMASAVVTDIGGPLSHGSIVAREYGIPAVMGTGIATRRIQSGQLITVDGSAGTVSLK
jgi:phosphohistidine swiveling domain-containing protein